MKKIIKEDIKEVVVQLSVVWEVTDYIENTKNIIVIINKINQMSSKGLFIEIETTTYLIQREKITIIVEANIEMTQTNYEMESIILNSILKEE